MDSALQMNIFPCKFIMCQVKQVWCDVVAERIEFGKMTTIVTGHLLINGTVI